MKHSWKSRKSSRYVVVLLGTSVVAASALATVAPAFAARITGPPPARSVLPRLSFRPKLSLLPVAARHALAPATKSRLLTGVFCTSASDCWAVGDISGKNGTLNQVLHWTGKRWFGVQVPSQGGTAKGASSDLFAVRCNSANDCWAVGDSQQPGSGELDQALHYDGSKWTIVQTPAPGGTSAGAFNALEDIACTSAKNCWAVGAYGLDGTSMFPEVSFNQVVHWNGRMWTFMKSPNPGGISMGDINALDAVRCTTPTSCWAAGTEGNILTGLTLRNEILFSNGKTWTTVRVPNPVGTRKLHVNTLAALACTSKADCWAVGIAGNLNNSKTKNTFEHNEALHWTGHHWIVVSTPNPNKMFDDLNGVTCVAAQDCWAVGSAGFGPGLNEAMHWNGAKWSLVHTVNGGGTGPDVTNTLLAVRCTSHSNCWAVGDAESNNSGTQINQILHWNGAKWQDS